MNKKLNILFITDHGGCLGGAENSMLILVKNLIDKGYNVNCLMSGKGEFYSALKDDGAYCKIFKMPTIERTKNPFILILWFLYLFFFGFIFAIWCKFRKIDIIHVNKTPSVFYGAVISWFSFIPLVWHVRNYNKNFGFVGKMLYKAVDAIICISNHIAAPYIDFFGDKRVHVVYNGVCIEPLKKVSLKSAFLREELKIKDNSFIAGMLTRITPFKKIEVFLEAMSIIRKKQVDAPIHGVVIGDCVTAKDKQMSTDVLYKENIMKLYDDLNLKDQLTFMGYKNGPEKYLADFDVLVLPSHNEPFGRVLIEAMALGVPVIGADSGAVPEIIDDGEDGFLVPLDAPDSLAEAIFNLYNHTLLRKRIEKAGWEKVNKKFSAKVYSENIEKIYNKVLSV